MSFRAVHHESGASVVLDNEGKSIAFIHSDGKTMTPAFEPEIADRIADLLNAESSWEAAMAKAAAQIKALVQP